MAKRDYYQVLDVPKTATEADLKKAYRRLAMKYHPDRNPGDASAEESFKEAKEAYEVLTDPQKRQIYDQYGHQGLEGQRAGGGGMDPGDVFGDIFGEVFGDIFGGGRRGGGRQVFRGSDLKFDLELTLEEAVFGKTVNIDVPTLRECNDCSGSGAAKGTKPVTCSTCNGQGQVNMRQGIFAVQQPCPQCRGRGVKIDKPCDSCYGQGRVRRTKTLEVKVPAGVDNGNQIRLSGEGEAGRNGGPSGDLFVEIHVKAHDLFERDGADLYCEVPMPFATAVLGGEIEVPTLDGHVKLKIPEGTQSGRMFRLRGKGIRPVRGNAVGDLNCKVSVETPVSLTGEQKEMLKNFDASIKQNTERHNPRSSSFLSGVKRFFDRMTS